MRRARFTEEQRWMPDDCSTIDYFAALITPLKLTVWAEDYNTRRPHSLIGCQTPCGLRRAPNATDKRNIPRGSGPNWLKDQRQVSRSSRASVTAIRKDTQPLGQGEG